GDVGDVAALAGVVDRDDVRVVDRGHRLRLADEALAEVVVRRELREQRLQRSLAAEQDVLRVVDDAHTAFAEHADDAIAADLAPDTKRYGELTPRSWPRCKVCNPSSDRNGRAAFLKECGRRRGQAAATSPPPCSKGRPLRAGRPPRNGGSGGLNHPKGDESTVGPEPEC